MPWPCPTDEELAAVQAAISDYAADFIDEHEDDVTYGGPPDGTPTDHPQHSVMVDASPELVDAYYEGLNAVVTAAGAPPIR